MFKQVLFPTVPNNWVFQLSTENFPSELGNLRLNILGIRKTTTTTTQLGEQREETHCVKPDCHEHQHNSPEFDKLTKPSNSNFKANNTLEN